MIQASLDKQRGGVVAVCDPINVRDVSRLHCAVRVSRADAPTYSIPCTLDGLRQLTALGAKLDEALRLRMERMEKAQRWVEETKTAQNVEPVSKPPVRAQLYQHQIKAYNIGCVLRSFAALMDMGTGKTLTAIAIMGRRWLDGGIRRVLIIAPTSVCSVWPAEFRRWADFPARVALLLGERDKRVAALKNLQAPVLPGMADALRVAVINYESTWRLETELRAFDADMIVCDESQRIKSPTAAQSKAIHRLGDCAKYRMMLTGTPVQNDTRDVWSQYRFLQPAVFGLRYHAFQARYAIMGGVGNHQYFGPRNLDELTRKVHGIAYRVTKEECLDLPEQTFEDRAVEMSDRARRLYRQIATESVAELQSGEAVTANIVLTRLLRLQQITGGYVRADDGALLEVDGAKMGALEDIVRDYCVDGGHKLVVFARFRAEFDGIRGMLDRALTGGLRSVTISGDVPAPRREELVCRFQTDDKTRVFVGQIDACAEGITLTAADVTVYYSVNWNLAKYQQSIARIHRVGQRNACTYIHLVCPGTIDEKVLDALKDKQDLAKAVTDHWQTYFDI